MLQLWALYSLRSLNEVLTLPLLMRVSLIKIKGTVAYSYGDEKQCQLTVIDTEEVVELSSIEQRSRRNSINFLT